MQIRVINVLEDEFLRLMCKGIHVETFVCGFGEEKDKKDKKEKKADREALAERALNEIKSAPAVQVKSDDEGEIAETDAAAKEVLRPVGALVPFANPLADEKVAKKVFKSVKKGS